MARPELKTAEIAHHKEIGRKVEQRWRALGFKSQQAFALKVGISDATIGGWAKGAGISVGHAVTIANYLGCSLDWLLADVVPDPGTSERSPKQPDAGRREEGRGMTCSDAELEANLGRRVSTEVRLRADQEGIALPPTPAGSGVVVEWITEGEPLRAIGAALLADAVSAQVQQLRAYVARLYEEGSIDRVDAFLGMARNAGDLDSAHDFASAAHRTLGRVREQMPPVTLPHVRPVYRNALWSNTPSFRREVRPPVVLGGHGDTPDVAPGG